MMLRAERLPRRRSSRISSSPKLARGPTPSALTPSRPRKAIDHCIAQLQLAERIGAHCCVNIAGSRNPQQWDGPHPENLLPKTFDLIVQTVRQIIDAVKPKRTSYSLETMPWIFPHSADSYLQLIKAIDRKACMVHLDPVNIVNCPERMYDTTSLLRSALRNSAPGCSVAMPRTSATRTH